MKIIRTARLWFKEGTSDKLYEVDLVENEALPGDQRFLVNFRYGRRGASLREGSKTPSPVARDAADRAFESVVVSKVNDGYRRTDQPSAPPAGADAVDAASAASPRDGRETELLARLAACLRSPWPAKDLDRLVWRIGQVRIHAAALSLIELAARQGPDNASYSLVWAIARTGGAAAAPMLTEIARRTKSEVTRDLALFALASPLVGDARAVVADARDLPEAVGRAAHDRDVDALAGALLELAGRDPTRTGPALVSLGRRAQGDADLHATLCAALPRLPARPPFLFGLRKLFKHAEMADDAALFGATAMRFETARPMYSSRSVYRGGVWVAELRSTVRREDLKGRPDARVGLSSATLVYMRRRIWRALRKRGELGDAAFAELAAGYLLAIRPEDMGRATRWTDWRRMDNGQFQRIERQSGPLGRNWTASQILSRNDPSAKAGYGSLAFSSAADAPSAAARTDAFPELWNARPDLALDLAAGSACEPVAAFGVTVLKDVPGWLRAAPVAAIARLLAAPILAAQRLGFEEARERLALGRAEPELLAALVATDFAEARKLAISRIDGEPSLPWADAGLAMAVLVSPHGDVDEASLRWAAERRISPDAGADAASRLAAWLLARPPVSDDPELRLLRRVRARMAALWRADDMPLGSGRIAPLLDHPAPAVMAAGVDALALSGTDAGAVPDETWRRLLGSDHVDVQTAALNLFGRLDDAALTHHAPLVVAFATAPTSALRQAARPLVARLAGRDEELRRRLARELIDSLFRAAPDDDYPADIVALLREAMPGEVAAIDASLLWRLLQARAKGAQLLGSEELQNRPFGTFSVRQTARLGNHPHLAARQWAMRACEADPVRFQREAADAVLLVESDWPDVQEFARRVFDAWPSEAWTPGTLAVVTDSVKPDVLAFARHLLRSRLAAADAPEQFARLLEHPAQSMHLVATEMLTGDAAASEAAFEKLLPLARVVMLQVQKGRIAKDRITAFLRAEAIRSADRASRIAPLFADWSIAGVERDRAAAILALRDIAEAHPGVVTPLIRRAAPEKAA